MCNSMILLIFGADSRNRTVDPIITNWWGNQNHCKCRHFSIGPFRFKPLLGGFDLGFWSRCAQKWAHS